MVVPAGECAMSILRVMSPSKAFLRRIIDVARDFPNCNAVAVDLVPIQECVYPFILLIVELTIPSSSDSEVSVLPPNCR